MICFVTRLLSRMAVVSSAELHLYLNCVFPSCMRMKRRFNHNSQKMSGFCLFVCLVLVGGFEIATSTICSHTHAGPLRVITAECSWYHSSCAARQPYLYPTIPSLPTRIMWLRAVWDHCGKMQVFSMLERTVDRKLYSLQGRKASF